jgi:glucose-6-phosphate isomerase
MDKIREERESGEIGYYNLPTESLSHIKAVDEMSLADIEQVVVIGIGGSSLGIKAIESILNPHTEDAKEMIFLENSDPINILEGLEKIQKSKAYFFIISKSGSTIETTSILKMTIEYLGLDVGGVDKERIFAITDEGSVLSDFAKYHNIREFNIPLNVGGRFSVLSAVGVVPLSVAGYDMRGLLGGASEFVESLFGGGETHLLDKASYIYHNSSKESINVLFSYANRLENFTKWFVQLWGESLGKIDQNQNSVGLTPIGLIGAVDQHSFLQLIIEGPKDKNVTFITIEDFQRELTIPNITLEGIEKTDFINNQSFNTLINAQAKATLQSIVDSNINADSITIDRVTPANIGALIVYYELLTSIVGAMFEIDTYNQPGVELGKVILYENLSS